MKKMKKLIMLLLIAAMLLSSFGCAAPTSQEQQIVQETAAAQATESNEDNQYVSPEESTTDAAAFEKQDATIGAACISLGGAVWVQLMTAADDTAEEYGATIVWKSAEGKIENQIAIVESFIEEGVDAIMIDPIDAVAIIPAINEALDAGIPVVTMGNWVKGGDQETVYNVSTCYPDARDTSALTDLLIAMNGAGTYGGIMGTKGNYVSDTREAAFIETCEAAGVNYVTGNGNWDSTTTLKLTEDIAASNADLKGIYNLDDSMCLISMQALDTGFPIAGHNGETVALDKIDAGEMVATILTGGYRMGQWNTEIAMRLINGEKFDPQLFMKTYIVMSDETKAIYEEAGLAEKYPDLEVINTDEAREIALFDGKYE